MKRDLQSTIDALRKESLEFQQTVVSALEAMKARREESLASTRHGKDFELAAYAFIEDACQKSGDIPEHTGERVGATKHCKVGDCVITLGPDCEAAGSRIVCEMKEDASCDLRRSLNEIETARANRGADVGLFIHSMRTAPNGLRSLARYGNDIVVVWDAEDELTDTYLSAAIMVCKALAVRKSVVDKKLSADFGALDKAIPGLGKMVKQNANVGVAVTLNSIGSEAVLEGKKARSFPLRFANGAVLFGPMKVGQVPPLF